MIRYRKVFEKKKKKKTQLLSVSANVVKFCVLTKKEKSVFNANM